MIFFIYFGLRYIKYHITTLIFKIFHFQRTVFDDLGRGVLDNAWKGYNCSLFAYGQTGSGKSYSMVGYGNNKGIVPIFCEELFKGVEDKKATAGENEEYQV